MAWNTDAPEAGSKEITSSWALFIMIMLLMFALFTSYILQQKKIQAVHETVLSIFAGMCYPGGGGRATDTGNSPIALVPRALLCMSDWDYSG